MVISWEPREVSEIRWFQNDRKGLPEAYPAITFPKLWQYFMKVEETQNVGYISEKIKEWKPKKIRHACSSYCRQKERIHTRPMYLSPIYENMRKKRKQMMQPMTARAILAFVQGRWTVSSWFPHFEHL